MVLTILFTDIVGSTELLQRVGQHANTELWRTHVALLREALAAHHGEEVKNVGDGIMAVFRSPSDAVACSVAIQQSVDRHNRRTSDPMGLRIGMEVGEVTPEEADYYGTAVVVAERLCKRAGGGQILTTDFIRTMTGSCAGHANRDVGPLELKGIAEPVRAVEVLWEPLPEHRLPLPHALGPIVSAPFVGREEELRKIRDAYARVRDGQREIVFLAGEPGIGKSRLATELAREAHVDGTTVLYGRCDETVTPYQPFVEALRHLVRTATLVELRDHAGLEAGELATLIPDLTRRLPHLPPPVATEDPESGRLRLFEAVAVMLARTARDRPLFFVLDDLHWADHATIQLLQHLVRIDPFPMLLLATYRETDLDSRHPLSGLLSGLHREHTFLRLRLAGLSDSEIVAAIERLTGRGPGSADRALGEVLRRKTDGNPFFIEQVLGHLIENGDIDREGGAAAREISVPEGVKELIGRRRVRLSETCNKLLTAASIAGSEVHVDVLEDVTGVSIDDLLDALDEAARARFLVEAPDEAGRYRFAHVLVRDAIYEQLQETRRTRLHSAIANALERRGTGSGPELQQIASHLLSSRPSGSRRAEIGRKAARYARRAAEFASQVFSHEEAAAAYTTALRALDLVGDAEPSERCELLLALGRAQTRARASEDALDALQRALQISANSLDPRVYARVAVAFGDAVRTSTKRESGIEIPVLENALKRLQDDDSAERVDVLIHFAERLGPMGTDFERAAELAQESVAVATRLGDNRRVLWSRDVLANNLLVYSGQERRAIIEENIVLAERLGDREWEIRTRSRRMAAAIAIGDVVTFDAELHIVTSLAKDTRDPYQLVSARWWSVMRRVMQGKWEAVEAEAQEILETGSRHGLPNTSWPGLLFIMRRAQRRLAEIESLIRAAASKAPFAWWKAGLVLALCERRREHEARGLLDELLAGDLEDVPRDWMWPMLLGLIGQCAHELADRDRAKLVYDRLLPYRKENIDAGGYYSGSAAVILGLCATTCGLLDTAHELFEEASALDTRSEAWPWLAVTQLEHAALLEERRATGDVDQALALISASVPRLEGFSLTPHVARAVGLRARLHG